MPILEVKNLKKSFDKSEILKGISFTLEKGKTLSVLGSSGSGKTTLLRCLNFLEQPEEGEITVNGKVLFDGKNSDTSESALREKRRHFGLVFQQFNLFPQYTALENVTLSLLLRGKDSREDINAAGMELLNKMGLAGKADNYPHQLSGGQQQRVAIARALMLEPDILCFDEPTSALDPELTGEVLKVIRELAAKNTTMIIVTHEIAFAGQISDEIIFMDGGVIAEQGDADSIINNPKSERIKHFLANYSKI